MSTDADNILQNSQQPASASNDGQSASAHSLTDQIAAAKFAASAKAVTRGNGLGFRSVRLRPGNNADFDRGCD